MITVDDLVQREVLCNVSCLISDLAKILPHVPGHVLRETSFDEDEMYDMFRQDDWEEPARWHIKHELAQEELQDLLTAEGYDDLPDSAGACSELLQQHLQDADEWRDFCDTHNIEPHTREVFCHYVVTDWFASRLKEHGEVIGEIGGLVIWGRTTCGQMISMDHVVQQIHQELVEA